MNHLIAAGVGSAIALMIAINATFSQKAGDIQSIVVVHLVGFLIVSFFVRYDRKSIQKQKVPVYLYLSGVLGIFILFSNNYCFLNLGASLTLTLGLIGQSAGSLLIDTFGLFGMTKRKLMVKRMIGISIMCLGVFLMIEKWEINYGYMLLSVFTGASVILTMVLNTRLAEYKGIFKGTQINFLTGGIVVIIAALFMQVDFPLSVIDIVKINPVLIFGGGLLGVIVVASINFVLPKIPVFYGTILIFLGQIITGVIIDYIVAWQLSIPKIIGGMVVFTGLIIDHNIELIYKIIGKSLKIRLVGKVDWK